MLNDRPNLAKLLTDHDIVSAYDRLMTSTNRNKAETAILGPLLVLAPGLHDLVVRLSSAVVSRDVELPTDISQGGLQYGLRFDFTCIRFIDPDQIASTFPFLYGSFLEGDQKGERFSGRFLSTFMDMMSADRVQALVQIPAVFAHLRRHAAACSAHFLPRFVRQLISSRHPHLSEIFNAARMNGKTFVQRVIHDRSLRSNHSLDTALFGKILHLPGLEIGQEDVHLDLRLNFKEAALHLFLSCPGFNAAFIDSNGDTLLHAAARYGYPLTPALFAKLHEQFVVRNRYGETPLHAAAEFGLATNIALLIADPKTDINATDLAGNTAAHILLMHERSCIELLHSLELFLAQQAMNVNAVNNNGETLLHIAARKSAPTRVVQRLLSRTGINLYLKDAFLRTALDIANQQGNTQISTTIRSESGALKSSFRFVRNRFKNV